jgi:hypothetical protein
MTVSRLRVAKSETRELGERYRAGMSLGENETDDWRMSNSTFFTAFVVIAGVLTVLAIALR